MMNKKLEAIKFTADDILGFIRSYLNAVELRWWVMLIYSLILSIIPFAIAERIIEAETGAPFLISLIAFLAFNYVFLRFPKLGAALGLITTLVASYFLALRVYNDSGIFWAISSFIIAAFIFFAINYNLSKE